MLSLKTTPPQHRQGFTIIELLIVIVVIAILAAISIVAYTGIQERARDTHIASMIRAQAKALNLYYVENGELPYTSDDCLGEPSDYPATEHWEAGQCMKSTFANRGYTTGDVSSKLKSVATGLPDGRIPGYEVGDFRGISFTMWGQWVEFEYSIPGDRPCPDIFDGFYLEDDDKTWCETLYDISTMRQLY